MKTPQQIIAALQALYKEADAVNDAYGYMWDDCLQQMDELQANMRVSLDEYEDSQPHEDQYKMHNTMSHVYQGTK